MDRVIHDLGEAFGKRDADQPGQEPLLLTGSPLVDQAKLYIPRWGTPRAVKMNAMTMLAFVDFSLVHNVELLVPAHIDDSLPDHVYLFRDENGWREL